MATTQTTSSWEKIRQGVKEAETLIGQKQYNLSMVKSRQTLEFMVRCLAERACLVEGDLSVMIDELFQGKWISKATCEHYHKIRMLGNKAVHDGNDSAYDANQAYHLLSQEVYTFANDYNTTRKRRPSGSGSSSSSSSRSRKRSPAKKQGFSLTPNDLLRILIVILCVVFVVAIFKFIKPGKKEPDETVPPTTVETTLPDETSAPETMAETTPAPVYKTSTVLNVRSEPSTSASKLGQLAADTVVDYVGPHDDEWAIINFEGQEAYVASQYLIHD